MGDYREKIYEEILRTEGIDIRKTDDKLLILDFGCYFPYSNQDSLHFNFKLGMDECGDKKQNHRYPNKGYVTLSKKYNGRKVSKLGYPLIIKKSDLDDKGGFMAILVIEFGISDNYMEMIYPLIVDFSGDKKVASLKYRHNAENPNIPKFSFGTEKQAEDGIGWIPYYYSVDVRKDREELNNNGHRNETILSFIPMEEDNENNNIKHIMCEQNIEAYANDLEHAFGEIY